MTDVNAPRRRRSWGIGPLANRIGYTTVIALVLNFVTMDGPLGLKGWWFAGIFFLATTVIVAIRR